MSNSQLIPMIDAGHGGMRAGVYPTPGKRSPDWEKGVLYEGMWNRWVANRVMEMCDRNRIPYFVLHNHMEDVSLSQRVARANDFYLENRNAYVLSLHANAGGGDGMEVYTSPGRTTSDSIAELFIQQLRTDFPDVRMRMDTSDGDMDKEANFTVVVKTFSPAILVEAPFMDHRTGYAQLWSEDFLDRFSKSIFTSVKRLYHS